MAIDHENVFITIVVTIEEIDSPAEIVIGNFSYTRRNGGIGKKFAALITIKGVCLVLKVADGQVQTVVFVVTKSSSHTNSFVSDIVASDASISTTSSNTPSPRLRNKKLGSRSLAIYRS